MTFFQRAIVALILATIVASPAFAQEDPTSADDKQFQAISDRYWKILERRPRRDTAFDLWYRHYLDAGKLEELAKRVLDQAAARPTDYAAQLLYGLVEERRGNDEQALVAYQAAEQAAPDNYYPPYLRAALLTRLQRQDEAAAALAKSLTLKPPRTELLEIYKRLGRLQLQQRKTAEALKTLADMAEAFPDDGQVLEELARLLADERQYAEALRRWEQLARLATDDPYQQLQARVEMAQLKLALGQRDLAVDQLAAALDQARPDSWLQRDIRRRIEQAFVEADDLEGLTEWCRKRLDHRPQDLATMVQLATALRQTGKPNEALGHLQRAVELAPSRRDLREAWIDALAASDKLPGAIAQCEILAQQHRGDADVLRRLGELHLQSAGDDTLAAAQQRAIAAWKQIAQEDSKDARLALQVAEICRQAAQQLQYRRGASPSDGNKPHGSTLLAVAEEHYRLAIERAPDEPQYHEYLGEFLHSQQRRQEAIEAWKSLVGAQHESAEAWHRLAEVYARFEYLDEAVAAARQALELKPDDFALHDFCLGLLLKQHDHAAALSEASQLDRLAEGDAARQRALKRRVEIHSDAGTVDKQIAALEKRAAAGDVTLADRWLLALLLADQWKFGEAARQFEAAVAEEGDDVALLQGYADALKRNGDLSRAVAQYQRLAGIDPRSRFSYYQEIIQLELERDNPTAAEQAAAELIKLAPASLEGYRAAASVAFRLKNDEAGFGHLRQAVKLAPRDIDVRSQLARALAERGVRAEALEHYWTSFELSEELSGKLPLVSAMADIAARIGTTDELLEKLRRLRTRQDNPKLLTLCLNEALVRWKRYGDAERELVALLDERGDDPDVLRQLASIAERQRLWTAAVGYQQRLVALDERRTNLETLARLLSEQGDADASARIWQRLLEQAKDDRAAASVVDRQLQQGRIRDALALARLHLQKEPQSWRLLLRAAFVHLMLDQKEEATACYESLLSLPDESAATGSNAANRPALAASSPAPATSSALAVPSGQAPLVMSRIAGSPSNIPAAFSAAYSLISGSALQRAPAFAPAFPETQEIDLARTMLGKLATALQSGRRIESLARPGAPGQPGRPDPVSPSPGVVSSSRTRASAPLFTPSFSDELETARLEATVGLFHLAIGNARLDEWIHDETRAGNSDPGRLRRAALACGANSAPQQAGRSQLLQALIESRPDDPLPHLIRLSTAPGPARAGQTESPNTLTTQQQLAELRESYAWLVQRQPAAERDLCYYYVMRLNALDKAGQAADVIDKQLQSAREFEDLGALPNLVLSSGDEALVRKLLARSAQLAAAAKLPPTAAPYLLAVLDHVATSGRYTGETELVQTLVLIDRYLAIDDSRAGQLIVAARSALAPAELIRLQAEARAMATALGGMRARNAPAEQVASVKRRYDSIVARLRKAGVEPNSFPAANAYLDNVKFVLIQRFAILFANNDKQGLLLERLARSAAEREGVEQLRYQLAAAFTLWWADDRVSSLAMLERLSQDHAHDQVIAVTLAQACYADNNLRQALAIVERIKNPDPSVAQSVESLRRAIRSHYSDLARLRDLKGHTHVVRSIAFSPDGKRLLSGSYDRSVRLWDVESGQFVRNFAGHTDLVLFAAWSPSGDRVASGSYDEIRIWDAETAACLTTITAPGGAVRSLAFSPDGRTLASAGDDRLVRLWNVDDGSALATLEGHTERVFCVAFSSDGKLLASAGGDKTVRLWNVDSRQSIDALTGHSASISCVAFAPDGKSLASGSDDNNVMLWRLPAGKAYATLQRHTDSVFSVAFSPDGRLLASGGADRSVKLWRLTSLSEEPATLLGHSNTVSSVAFSSDGKTLASGGYDEVVKLWTLLTPAEKK